MNTLESFDRLDLDDDQLFNHEIDSISTIESLATINQRQGLLPFDEQSTIQQFKRQACLVRGLQHSWPQLVVHGNRRTDDCLGQ